MNEKIPDELLSASFDGELSPDDQGRVDAHLEEPIVAVPTSYAKKPLLRGQQA